MSTKKPTGQRSNPENLFGKANYVWIIGGLVCVGLGLILMAGGKSSDPEVFLTEEIYSFRRITLAPLLILAGLGMQVVAIFRKPKG